MIWALLLIPLAVALVLGYAISRSMIGKKAAGRNLLTATLLFLLMLGLIVALFSLPNPWRDYSLSAIFVLFSVLLWISILSWPQRKRRAGSLLWNLGRPTTHRAMLIAGGLFALSAILQTIMFAQFVIKGFPESYNTPEFYLSQIILYWSTAFYCLWAGMSRLQLRENGIYFKFGFIRWEQVASYKWEGDKGNTLTVWLNQRLPIFQTRSWVIPSAHKATIERILAYHVSSRTRATENFSY